MTNSNSRDLSSRLPPLLKVGERVRFTDAPYSQLYEIGRVTSCAAYPYKVYDPPRRVEFTEKDGSTRVILATRGQVEPGISRHAFVIREEEGR